MSPLKGASSRGGSVLHLIHGSMDPHESESPNGISIGSAVFAQLTRVLNTDTKTQTTLRATSVAIDRIYALRAGDAA